VSRQERKLPSSDQELVLHWEMHDRNYSAVARTFDANESSVRKRIRRYYGDDAPLTDYRTLPIPLARLYQEWLALGAKYGAATRLAERYDIKPDTVRKALRRFREGNSRDDG